MLHSFVYVDYGTFFDESHFFFYILSSADMDVGDGRSWQEHS